MGDMQRELHIVQARKEQVAREISDLDRRRTEIEHRRAELEREMSDLAVTERTMARLMSISLPEPETPTPLPDQPSIAVRRKPKGTPSIYIMSVTLLRESQRTWVDGQDLLAMIRQRWWPTATSRNVTPTLWRLAQVGKLRKDDTKYALPGDGAAQQRVQSALNGEATVADLIRDQFKKLSPDAEGEHIMQAASHCEAAQ